MERELKKKYNGDKTLYDPELKRWKAAHKYARGSIHDLLDHIDHIAKVAGPEYIGIGSDFDGVNTASHAARGRQLLSVHYARSHRPRLHG